MKKNKLFLAVLASAMLVGCADEEFAGVENNVASQGLNGKLVDAGMFSVDANGELASRSLSPVGNFVWMPTELDNTGALTANRMNQRVGLCWTGINNQDNNYSAAAAVTGIVFRSPKQPKTTRNNQI